MTRSHLALLLPSFQGGGAGRVMLNLAGGFAGRGHRVDLAVLRAAGPYLDRTPPGVRVVELCPGLGVEPVGPEGFWSLLLPTLPAEPVGDGPGGSALAAAHLRALVRYLRRERPAALLSAWEYHNLLALSARRHAAVPTRIAVGAHTLLSESRRHPNPQRPVWWWRYLLPMLPKVYPQADAWVAVSDAAAEDLSRVAGLPRGRIATIRNPVVGADLLAGAGAPLDHPWFGPGAPPVVLGAGRLAEPKNFPSLIRAFARVRDRRRARLVILGEGPLRAELEALAASLGVGEDVALPGFAGNPWAFMARAGVFVLSSRWEGFGNVLVEALACGCPVVSTDCPGGPPEILAAGAHGRLVPVGDDRALAAAILATLAHPPPPDRLRDRARRFSIDDAVERYLDVPLAPDPIPAAPHPRPAGSGA